MFKLANQILDAYDDVEMTHLKKLAKANPTIYMMTPEEKANIPDEDFALSIITKKASKLNKFPVNSFDSTWLSNEYFEVSHNRLPKQAAQVAAHHIKKACEKYDIPLKPAVAGCAKEASANVYCEPDLTSKDRVRPIETVELSKFAQVQQIGDSDSFATYTFATPTHVKIGCQYFEKYVDELPMEYRHRYAAAIQKRAGELGMGAQKGKVAKYASDIYSAHVDAHLRSRASLLEVADPKYTQALSKMASMKKEMAAPDFAKLLHGFDKRAGLNKYYGSYLTNPYEATFAQQTNPWAGYTAKLASGASLSSDEITQVSNEKYAKIKEYFGHDVADELKKHGVSIFESLPNDAKEIIAGIANGQI